MSDEERSNVPQQTPWAYHSTAIFVLRYSIIRTWNFLLLIENSDPQTSKLRHDALPSAIAHHLKLSWEHIGMLRHKIAEAESPELTSIGDDAQTPDSSSWITFLFFISVFDKRNTRRNAALVIP